MNKKLLLSTALVGGMISGSSAIAQTTVSGSLDLHYRAQKVSGGLNSNEGLGRETQLNIANKGKLNNGWDYLAGFSLEFDGNQRNPVSGTQDATVYKTQTSTTTLTTGATSASGITNGTTSITNLTAATTTTTFSSDATEANSISNENIYIDFINAGSGTTITVGVDHIQNITGSVVPQVMGNTIDNVAVGMGAKATNTMGANPKESIGFGIIQAIPAAGLTASAWYAPNNGDFGVRDQYNANGGVTGIRNSAYELGLTGANVAGVKGLSLRYFYNKEEKSTSALSDIEGRSYGIAYQAGDFGIGAEKHTQNRTGGTSTVDADLTVKTYGVTYAASQNVTLGLTQLRTDTVGLVKEKITSLQLGYNLGPVAVIAAYSKGDDVGGVAGVDNTEGAIRLSTKF
jgi:Gram-negative porin